MEVYTELLNTIYINDRLKEQNVKLCKFTYDAKQGKKLSGENDNNTANGTDMHGTNVNFCTGDFKH